jgi:hypothetical protein
MTKNPLKGHKIVSIKIWYRNVTSHNITTQYSYYFLIQKVLQKNKCFCVVYECTRYNFMHVTKLLRIYNSKDSKNEGSNCNFWKQISTDPNF